MLLLRNNREFRSPATQDGLGLSGLPFFSLFSHRPQPLQPLLAPRHLPSCYPSLHTPLQGLLTLALLSPSLIAEPLLKLSCLF